MTITMKERAEWRKIFRYRPGHSSPLATPKQILRILDALEAAEASVEELRHQVFEHEHNANFAEGVANSALARAEAAERERDALARELSEQGCPQVPYDFCPHEGNTCDPEPKGNCWLEWARQQARGGGI